MVQLDMQNKPSRICKTNQVKWHIRDLAAPGHLITQVMETCGPHFWPVFGGICFNTYDPVRRAFQCLIPNFGPVACMVFANGAKPLH